MKPISLNEAKDLFFASDAKYVSQEQASIYYDNFSGKAHLDIYVTHDCLVVKSDSDWHIHAIRTESDVLAAIDKVKGIMNFDSEHLMVLTWNQIPEELADCRGAYKFARGYLPYQDQSIRSLTTADAEQIKKCCALDPEDTPIGKHIAEEFLTYYNDLLIDPYVTTLGLFEKNNLVGFVQAFQQKELDFATINIYINKSYRKKGYAKRLLSALCATSENIVYCYSCVKTNTASINTAKSCGFQFKGAYLSI